MFECCVNSALHRLDSLCALLIKCMGLTRVKSLALAFRLECCKSDRGITYYCDRLPFADDIRHHHHSHHSFSRLEQPISSNIRPRASQHPEQPELFVIYCFVYAAFCAVHRNAPEQQRNEHLPLFPPSMCNYKLMLGWSFRNLLNP